jgi:hypothetical protein
VPRGKFFDVAAIVGAGNHPAEHEADGRADLDLGHSFAAANFNLAAESLGEFDDAVFAGFHE